MQATPDQTDLKPPRTGRWSAPLVLALLAHLLLVAALTWGVNWKQDTQPAAFEAELWSSVVQQAAPREVKPPPPTPRPEPKVEPKVEPKPKPTPPKPEPKAEPEPPDTREADIAIEKAKKKKEEEAKKREIEKKEAAKKKAEEQARAEEAAKKKKAEEAKRRDDQKKLDEKIKQLAKEKARKLEEQREAASAKARDDQMRRILGQAGATGGESAKGTAQRASGPSNSYGGRVNAAVRPNVLLTEDIPGNPKAEIEVRSAPDGTIISRRLARSSGNAAWDKAALDAIDRTGKMPRDVDGRVPSPLIIEMRPRD
ncbi:hypothetical protein LPB72_18245 [Hydrogenophaga crassostreae]|uniref:Protein TolA n=1 Tax=Hydrogenophaga crassostreae TaxID=1763535 RepID=A0A167H0I2_9BURK|nr:cell envelope integrity protein TolA [Hydrogenophaga crassostreae]AOW12919.1 protein TolA [Hydrogenophaga crassostreae]OAD40103.1 hypothetical protein LPB72_18245 [Hydrogenophaga crassostreae]